MKSRIEYLIKHNPLIQKLYIVFMSALMRILGLFVRINDKQILFNSLAGLNYNDSPKRIYDYLIADEQYKDYTFIWAFQDVERFDIPKGKKIKMDSLKYFIEALRSRYWITNMNIERGLKFKKRKQKYLNTWHGIGTKTMGLSEPGRKDYDFSNINTITVQSDFEAELFHEDFKASKSSTIKIGLPRNDILFNYSNSNAKKLKSILNIPSDKQVILYAPTWRESTDKGKTYAIAPPMSLTKWKSALKDKYVFLFRTHHRTNKVMNVQFDDFFIDVSNYPEMNELLMITDILITDYSTSIFDFSILGRPFFIYGYDYEDYKKTRGFVMNYEAEMPFGIQKTETEVIDAILNKNKYSIDKIDDFNKKYVQYGGNATEESVKNLFT